MKRSFKLCVFLLLITAGNIAITDDAAPSFAAKEWITIERCGHTTGTCSSEVMY